MRRITLTMITGTAMIKAVVIKEKNEFQRENWCASDSVVKKIKMLQIDKII